MYFSYREYFVVYSYVVYSYVVYSSAPFETCGVACNVTYDLQRLRFSRIFRDGDGNSTCLSLCSSFPVHYSSFLLRNGSVP